MDALEHGLKFREMAKQLVEDLGFTDIIKHKFQQGVKPDLALGAYKEVFDKALAILQSK